jgi:hypothetical protein
VSGRENSMSASCMAIALASPGPIQMGSTRSPPISSRMTTGVFVERSSPRLWTLTSTSTRRGPPNCEETTCGLLGPSCSHQYSEAGSGFSPRTARRAGRPATRLRAPSALRSSSTCRCRSHPKNRHIFRRGRPRTRARGRSARRRRWACRWGSEPERSMIASGRKSKTSATGAGDLVPRDLAGAEGVDVDRHRLGDADRVRELDLAAPRQPRGHDVLGRPARRVGRRAVDLGRVLARERAAPVAAHPP